MTDGRERIFAAIAAARAARVDPAPYPEWDDELAVAAGRLSGGALVADFRRNMEAAAGLCFDGLDALVGHLEDGGARAGYCDPALPAPLLDALARRFELCSSIDRAGLDELDFAVSRASGAVAETGSLILTDRHTPDRLAAVATWTHVAVLNPDDVVAGLTDAIARVADDPYAVFVTGPSQTADVEGILIRGVHGPGVQACLLWPLPSG